MKPKYYRAVPFMKRRVGVVFDAQGNEINEAERGLDGQCQSTPLTGHNWLVYPDWSVAVREGGKRYIICLNCDEKGHL